MQRFHRLVSTMRPLGLAALLALGLAAPAAEATTILVKNASFETLPSGGLNFSYVGGPYSVGAIPDWTSPAGSGQWAPNGVFLNPAPDGSVAAYSNDFALTQDVSVTAIAGVTYTLLADLGYRSDLKNFGAAILMIGGVSHGGVLDIVQNSKAWFTTSVVYTATAADEGKAIVISLEPNGAGRGQALFDNIRLSDDRVIPVSPAPEPSTWAMMLGGFGAIGVGLRRRRNRATA